MMICEGCGGEFTPDQMEVVETEVNLRDGTKRRIRFDGRTCCDFWDETEPGDWVPLASGEEVQRASWQCAACDGVSDCHFVKMCIDTEYDATAIVCGFCRKKEKGRFKRDEERSVERGESQEGPGMFATRSPLEHKRTSVCVDDRLMKGPGTPVCDERQGIS